MRQPIILIAAGFMLLTLLGGFWLVGAFGDGKAQARQTIHKILEDLGFLGPIVPAAAKKPTPYTFDKIVLDPDEFGRIKQIRTTLPGLFDFGKAPFKRLEIDRLSLTGGIGENGEFSLSGVQGSDRLETKEGFLQILNLADTIVLNKAKLDILSEVLGGFSLETTLELQRTGDSIQISGSTRSVQKQFSLEGKVSGTVTPVTGEWELAFEIEDGKANIPPFLLSRLYGEISMAGNAWSLNSLYGQSTAGSMAFYGFTFQAPSFTFELRDGLFKALSEAKEKPEKAADEQGLEFSLLYSSAKPGAIQASIFSPDIPLLIEFLKLPKNTDVAPVKNLKNINLILEAPFMAAGSQELRIPFIVKSQDDATEKSGFSIINIVKSNQKAELSNIFWKD